jgi:aminopeptidase N
MTPQNTHKNVLLSAFIILFLPFCAWSSVSHSPVRVAEVIHYQADIKPNLQTSSLTGVVILTVRFPAKINTLTLNAGQLQILSVREKQRQKMTPLLFTKIGSLLTITLTQAKKLDRAQSLRLIEVSYQGSPTLGITFLPEASQIFTAFATSQWLPSVDAPHLRVTFTLTLTVPVDFQVIANGVLTKCTVDKAGNQITTWVEAKPMPTYLFGFAMGLFREVIDETAKPTLRYLAPMDFSVEELQQIFRDTRSMIRFYESKAGMPFPGQHYTQVLVSTRAAQEMAGFAVMGERYGRRVLENEKSTWLAAHELSHQWWGNNVTNHQWTEFWLNEGLASFMNAAYFENQYGHDEYLRHINAAKNKYEKIRDEGNDKPLIFPDWNQPSANDRSLAYDKGAYVMHLLRAELGEAAFWAGIKRYTQLHWGKAVKTDDFVAAMEAASSKKLTSFFATWVYPTTR